MITVHTPFQTTHWSVILASGEGGDASAESARDHLCQAYWKPLYCYLRRSGLPSWEAEDVIQDFLVTMMERDVLAGVHPHKGKFRSFLIASLKNFLGHHRRRQKAQKRGGAMNFISLNDTSVEGWLTARMASQQTPDVIFEQQWVLTLLEQVRERLQEDYAAAGKADYFQYLAAFLPGAGQALSQDVIARRLGTTVSAVKSEVYRLKQRYGQYLRWEIARTVSSPEEIDGEIQHLMGIMSGGMDGAAAPLPQPAPRVSPGA